MESTCLQEIQGAQRNEPCTVEYVAHNPLQIRQLTYDTALFGSTILTTAGPATIAIVTIATIAITIGLRKNFRSHTQEHDSLSFAMKLVKPKPSSMKASAWGRSEVLPESSCQSVGYYSHFQFPSNLETRLETHL